MARVLASTQITQRRAAQIRQAENLVQLPVGQEPSIGGDLAAVEFQLQAAVEIDPQRVLSRVTRWVTRVRPVKMMVLH